MKTTPAILLVIACIAAEVRGEAAKSLRLVLPPQPTPVIENIARVFVRQVQSRCDARVVTQGEAPLVVKCAQKQRIGDEGFTVADDADGSIRIAGNDARGLLYGVGKFLHTSAYGSQGFAPGSWRGTSVPNMPVRRIYLATHSVKQWHTTVKNAAYSRLSNFFAVAKSASASAFLPSFLYNSPRAR
jgi:hypothetical protein